ncbi:HAMP domain-containing histidine kinase [Myxococcota bacterium]|nr:HAMP domain-containing histidine kinase [Myxococcota bacterium]
MKLATRLVLAGAVLPSALLCGASLAGGLVFERLLVDAVDRTLLGQAAVEAVSLFDGPNQTPHLHIEHSPLADQLEPYAGTGALYGPDGVLITAHREHPGIPRTLDLSSLPTELDVPRLETTERPRARTLTVRVRSPKGEPHVLVLAASLAHVDGPVDLYHRTVSLAVLVLALATGIFQVLHARSIARRVGHLASHMARLREGDFATPLAPDPHDDEIAELRGAIADATEKLAAAKDSRDRLVADAAHELRTPLAAMRTTIDVTLRRERSAAELGETLRELREEVMRLAELATKLLDLARLRSSRVEQRPDDLRRVVDEVVERWALVAKERDVELDVTTPESAPACFAFEGVKMALSNLVSNALHFAPPKTVIDVVLEHHGDGWRFVVRDRGPGVPADRRDVIFEPFHRLDHRHEGAGLGLAIVRDVAEQHRGRAYVSAAWTAGAELVLELPAH